MKDNEEESDDDDDGDANGTVPEAEVDDAAYDSFDDDADDDVDDDRDDDVDAEVIDDEVVYDETTHHDDELDDEVQFVDGPPSGGLEPAVDYVPNEYEDLQVPEGEEDLLPPTLSKRQKPRRTVKRKISEDFIYDLKRARK